MHITTWLEYSMHLYQVLQPHSKTCLFPHNLWSILLAIHTQKSLHWCSSLSFKCECFVTGNDPQIPHPESSFLSTFIHLCFKHNHLFTTNNNMTGAYHHFKPQFFQFRISVLLCRLCLSFILLLLIKLGWCFNCYLLHLVVQNFQRYGSQALIITLTLAHLNVTNIKYYILQI